MHLQGTDTFHDGINNNNNNNNFIYPGKDRSVDQDIDWLVLISDQYKKHQKKKVNKELQTRNQNYRYNSKK